MYVRSNKHLNYKIGLHDKTYKNNINPNQITWEAEFEVPKCDSTHWTRVEIPFENLLPIIDGELKFTDDFNPSNIHSFELKLSRKNY